MNSDEPTTKRMQVKVLYSFNNTTTVFLSRSSHQYVVKIAQIPMMSLTNDQESEMMTVGAFDLKACVQQIIKSSPENFKLHSEDYAVYYKDITEQPDEPFVSNGELSNLINSSKQLLIPGRVCQNLSATYLFGDKSNASSLTLEIRLKLHTIEGSSLSNQQAPQIQQQQQTQVPQSQGQLYYSHHSSQKRSNESPVNIPQKRSRPVASNSASSSSALAAAKATRTKSLPIFNNIPSQTMFNIMNHDKMNTTSRYDSKSVQDRFKLAPFLQAKIIDKPMKKHRKSVEQPQRAMRTRSMISLAPVMISSPITEEQLSDSTDDTEYRENRDVLEEEEEEDDAELEELSPYTPQQPPYNSSDSNSANNNEMMISSSNAATNKNIDNFQSLPDLEDLDSKRTHTIPHTKLPKNHGLSCVNSNCATISSITWRYFETEFRPNYFAIHRAKEFDKKHYDGMFGPLCNACYLFLRNKGFMRPENVVKKYLQQQRYKKELKNREELTDLNYQSSNHQNNPNRISHREKPQNLSAIAMRKSSQYASSPVISHTNKFPTPSHTPSVINQVIQNNQANNYNPSESRQTPNYNDLNDFMNQINSFGGPLTDIDPLPQDLYGVTPPMMATKSNTRVINLYDDGEDKENCPPSEIERNSPNTESLEEFDNIIAKSFNQGSEKSSPMGQTEWINNLFAVPTPKDQVTPLDSKSPTDGDNDKVHPNLPHLKTFSTKRSSPRLKVKNSVVANMPSSPLLTSRPNSDELESFLNDDHVNHYSEMDDEINELVTGNQQLFHSSSSPNVASRNDTGTLNISWTNQNTTSNDKNSSGKIGSTPNTELYSNDDMGDQTHTFIKARANLDIDFDKEKVGNL